MVSRQRIRNAHAAQGVIDVQPCNVCGSTGVDSAGYCEGCRVYLGTPSQLDDGSSGETMRVYAPSSGGGYYPAMESGYGGPQPISPMHPAVSSGPPYPEPVRPDPAGSPAEPARPQPVRRPSIAPLFMVTVMVVVIVVGAVSIVYILAGDRGGVPRAGAAQPTASAPASGAPDAAPGIDQCLVGTWALTRWVFAYKDDEEFTSEGGGGIYRYRADGTGEWDFGSGVEATGKYDGKTSTARMTGRVTFDFTTANGMINYRNMKSNAGLVVYQSGRVVADNVVEPAVEPEKYTCAGDNLRITSDGDSVEARRR
jgi:hypothetical protein